MEKFDRIRVLAPLNLVLYIGALWLAWFMPGWGNLALAVMDLATIGVVLLAARRFIERYQLSSWEQLGPKLVGPTLALFGLAIVHLVGAFLRDDTVQHCLAYLPVTVVVIIGGSYVLDKAKPPYRA